MFMCLVRSMSFLLFVIVYFVNDFIINKLNKVIK